MRFEAGTTLAHYEILSLLGRGGMGEVYRASDGKLGREVAIKVLPEDFTRDEERLARFEREARVLASLDHPHVASIHGIEHLDGVRFLVMQLARGEDLSKRLVRGPLPLEEVISVAKQIAEALEAAHGQGIIHRDLKPANIRIDEEGKIKVLDFGLAKALEGDETEEEISNSPTMIRAATHAGVILGTAAYMSPEQARGKRVDRRADIWAFGVVLWEMLTGKRLFSGDTVSDTLAAVLRADVDLNQLPSETPRAIRDLIRRCLTRDPRNRLHDIADARIVLQDVDPEDRPGASGTPLRSRGTVGWIAALISAVAVAAVLLFLLLSRGAEPREPQHFALHLSGDQSLMMGGNSLLTFSPDGKSLIFSGAQEGKGRVLFRRDLGQRQAVAIAGTDQGESPFVSPDGRWLGFVARGKMMKIPSEGGRPFALADARGAGGAAWLSDDTIVFAPIYSDGLFRISAEGGTPERLTTPDRAYGELGHWWPEALPGESRIVFTAFRTPIDRSRIGVVDLKTGQVHWVVEGGFFGRYVSTGHLVYAKGERLYAIPFDPKTATAQGAAVAVLDDLKVSQSGGFAMLAVSPKGTLAYVSSTLGNPLTELVWIDRTGKTTPALPERKRFLSASLSPDGNHAAVTIEAASRDLWIYSFDRGTLSRQTSGDATEFDPQWSADGRELFYVVDSPPFELHRIAVGAPDSGRPIWKEKAERDTTGIAVSPDGRTLAFVLTEPETGTNLYTRPIDGSEPPRAIRATSSEESNASFSPDGRWIVYQSDETGRPELYVEPFPGPGQRVQITADGGHSPLWAGNGEILYRSAGEMRVISTRLDGRFEFDPRRPLFDHDILDEDTTTFDVTADGSLVLAVTMPEINRPRQIEMVTDWAAELNRLAPARR